MRSSRVRGVWKRNLVHRAECSKFLKGNTDLSLSAIGVQLLQDAFFEADGIGGALPGLRARPGLSNREIIGNPCRLRAQHDDAVPEQ